MGGVIEFGDVRLFCPMCVCVLFCFFFFFFSVIWCFSALLCSRLYLVICFLFSFFFFRFRIVLGRVCAMP